MIYLLIFLHFQACSWFFVVKYDMSESTPFKYEKHDHFEYEESRWYPPTDWLNYRDSKFFEINWFDQYIISLYHSFLFLGFNEIGPTTCL